MTGPPRAPVAVAVAVVDDSATAGVAEAAIRYVMTGNPDTTTGGWDPKSGAGSSGARGVDRSRRAEA